MKTNFTVKVYAILMTLTFLISGTLFLSCKKIDLDHSNGQGSFMHKAYVEKTISSLNGFVTGENGQPVAGAGVFAGSKTCITDEYGYFEFTEADINTEAAVVTVKKEGFFNGIKTYDPDKGQQAFFRIKLIPKTKAGTINAAQGGIVSLQNGLSILFPAAGFMNDATGEAYHGTVYVAAFWINPAADDINEIMPGDLRAVNTAGVTKRLTSYGMAAVELTGASGQKLQLLPGKPATITMPMSASILDQAPPSIPLWHFDEAKGLWIEEGYAVKKGNTYIGEVTHFSFWNCDWPEYFVKFECTAVNAANEPLNNVRVRIYEIEDPNNATGCYTNAAGYVSGFLPANSHLMLEILGDGDCAGVPVYTQIINTGNSNISLPLITITHAGLAMVSGTIKDCYNNQVSNGGIFMQKNGQYYHYPVDKNGSFSFTTIVCNNTDEISLMAYDAVASVYSNEKVFTITAGSNNNFDLQACGNTSSQFIHYTINGVPYKLTYPAASFTPVDLFTNYTFNIANNITNTSVGIQFSAANIATNSIQQLHYFNPNQVTGPFTTNEPIAVHITEAGEADQVVVGNFSGLFMGPAPAYTAYNISCSFRIKCEF